LCTPLNFDTRPWAGTFPELLALLINASIFAAGPVANAQGAALSRCIAFKPFAGMQDEHASTKTTRPKMQNADTRSALMNDKKCLLGSHESTLHRPRS